MRKLIPALVIVAGYVFSAVLYFRLPPLVSPQWDALIPWVAAGDAEAIPRAVAAFGLPTLALAVWLLLRALASGTGERLGRRVFPAWLLSARTGAAAVERFEPTFETIVTAVVAFVLLFHATALGTALGWPAWTRHAFGALVGVGIIVIGNVMPRTRPNWIAGLRTRHTMSDPDLWRRTHRLFGGLLMATGLIAVMISIVSAPYAILAGLAGMVLSALIASVGARRGRGAHGGGETPPLTVLLALLLAATASAAQAPVPASSGSSERQSLGST